MRDKLIELLRKATIEVDEGYPMSHYKCRAVSNEVAAYLADHLIANGVVVATENNVGCKGCLYENRKRPQKCSCCSRNIDMKDCYTPDYDRHWTEKPPKGE